MEFKNILHFVNASFRFMCILLQEFVGAATHAHHFTTAI